MIKRENIELVDEVNKKGFTILKNFPERDLLLLAAAFGFSVSEDRDGVLIKDLYLQESNDAPQNTLSREYGKAEFPFHTEAAYWKIPPKYMMLFCVNPGSGGRQTRLLTPPLTSLKLCQQHVLNNDIWTVFPLRHPFLTTISENRMIRYDMNCMRPSVSDSESAVIMNQIINESPITNVDWEKNQLLIINNHKCLHSRSSNFRPSEGFRKLKRVLIKERF